MQGSTESAETVDGIVIKSQKCLIDNQYPLFSWCFHEVRYSQLVFLPFMCFFFIQVLVVSLWPWSKYWYNENSSDMMNLIRTVVFFIPQPSKPYYYLIMSIIIFLLSLLTLVFEIYEIIYYNMRRKFIKSLNYMIILYYDTILVATIVPCIVCAGETFLQFAKGSKDYMIIISFILFVITVAYQSISFVIYQNFATRSICIESKLLTNFDCTALIFTLGVLFSTIPSYFIVSLFEEWAKIFIYIISIPIFAYQMYIMTITCPYTHILTLVMSYGWFFGTITGNILSTVCYFTPKLNKLVPIIIVLMMYGAGTVVGFFYFVLHKKKVKKLMSVEFQTQEEAFSYYDSLGLAEDPDKASVYFRIAFQNYCVAFYDLTLANYIIEHHEDEETLATVLQIVTFFPKEVNIQNRIQKILYGRRSLHYATKFLLFQIEILKSLRVATISAQNKIKLIELRTMSRQVEFMSKAALDQIKLTPEYFEALSEKAQRAKAIWKEALDNAPNNPKFCEEYTRYLIEAECDFPESIRIKNRQNEIELGSTFKVDYSFMSMVAAFPYYLKRKIVDFRGTIIKHMVPINPNDSFHNNNQSKDSEKESNSSSSILDAELEDFLGKDLIKLSRARIALHRTLENKIPASIKSVKIVALLMTVYILAIFIFGVFFSVEEIDKQVTSLERIDALSLSRFYSALSNVNLIMEFARELGLLKNYTDLVKKLERSDDHPFILPYSNMLPQIVNFTTKSGQSFELFMNLITDHVKQGEKGMYEVALSLFDLNYELDICYSVENSSMIRTSFSTVFSQILMNQRLLSGRPHVMNSLQDTATCEITRNFRPYYFGAETIFESISSHQHQSGKDTETVFKKLAIIIPCITFVIVFIPVLIVHFMINRSIKELISMMQSFEPSERQNAKNFLMIKYVGDDVRVADTHGSSKTSIYLMIVMCILTLLFLTISYLECAFVVESNDNVIKLNQWNKYASLRLSLSAESLNTVMILVAVHPYRQYYQFSSFDSLDQLAVLVLNGLLEADKNLIDGTSDSSPCQGFDEELDRMNIVDARLSGDSVINMSEFYANASIHKQIGVYENYVNSIIAVTKNPEAKIPEDVVANAIYLADFRLFYRLMAVADRLSDLGFQESADLKTKLSLLLLVAIIIIIAFIFVVIIYYKNRVATYQAVLFLVKRFNPYMLVNNKTFDRRFLKNSGETKKTNLTIEGSIIKNANEAIFLTNVTGIVEVANNSTNTLIGFQNDQILGQNVATFFIPDDVQKVTTKLEQMRNGQSSTFYEDDFTVVNDCNKEIPVHVTIIGMKKDDEVNSFAIFLRDQEKLITQKKIAKEEKAKSEKLLYQILPRDIVVQLNKGEKDISFVVPSATIVFIDINKFSDYASNLNPTDIMANLSTYFAYIDKIATKYNMLQKIKLIGDIYMAAAGLFNTDVPPEQHAEQTILFALECVEVLDEINTKLEANLQIRTGINTGGPVIAGVLGTDKPAFDIIGDPINVAARLQSTCEVNKVHISQDTYTVMKGFNYDFVKRGETFLKGKGYQLTYYVNHPQKNSNPLAGFVIK